MGDGHSMLVEAFRQRLEQVPQLADLDDGESVRLGREAAEAVIGPLLLRELLGPADRLDTTQVALLLRMTRQAVHKRVRSRALLGVPGRGTTWFPAWQFDLEKSGVKPVVTALLSAWVEASGDTEPDAESILIWAKTPQPELDETSPEDWIRKGNDDGPLLSAARAAARALAT